MRLTGVFLVVVVVVVVVVFFAGVVVSSVLVALVSVELFKVCKPLGTLGTGVASVFVLSLAVLLAVSLVVLLLALFALNLATVSLSADALRAYFGLLIFLAFFPMIDSFLGFI